MTTSVWFNFPYEDEEGMLDALIMADVNVIDIESEDGKHDGDG